MTDPNAPSPDDAIANEFDLGIDVDEFADEIVETPEPEAPAVAATVDFFDAGPDAAALDTLHLADRPPVLERLGPAHFRSKGFSFMGFLQTVYEHVATETGGETRTDELA